MAYGLWLCWYCDSDTELTFFIPLGTFSLKWYGISLGTFHFLWEFIPLGIFMHSFGKLISLGTFMCSRETILSLETFTFSLDLISLGTFMHGMFPSLQTFTFIWGVPFPWDIWFPPRSCFPLDSGELLSLRLQGVAFPWDRSSLGRFISPETLTDSVSHEVHNIHFPAVGMVMVWLSLVTSTKQQLSTKTQDNAALVPLILSQLSLGPKIKGLNC